MELGLNPGIGICSALLLRLFSHLQNEVNHRAYPTGLVRTARGNPYKIPPQYLAHKNKQHCGITSYFL